MLNQAMHPWHKNPSAKRKGGVYSPFASSNQQIKHLHKRSLHNRTILLLLLLIRPTQPLPILLGLASTLFELFKSFLGLGEFVC